VKLHQPSGQRQPLGASGPNDAFNPDERLLQDLFVKEKDCGERLVLGGRRDVVLDGQMRQKPIDILLGKARGWRYW